MVIILLVCESSTNLLDYLLRHRYTDFPCADLVLNKISFLDNIGRTTRSRKNEKLENFLTDLQRLTIVHETDHGGSYYRFSSGAASPAKPQGEDKTGKGKDAKTQNKAQNAKGVNGKVEDQGRDQKQGQAKGENQGEKNGGSTSQAPTSTDDEASSTENQKVQGGN